jgi:hypothetical protein
MGKSKHKISNWKQYNQALVQRGSLTVWMDEQAIQQWHCQTHHGRRGRGFHYSDSAIETALMLKAVFKLPLRALEGFINSLFQLMKVPLQSPDYSCISKRAKTVEIKYRLPSLVYQATLLFRLIKAKFEWMILLNVIRTVKNSKPLLITLTQRLLSLKTLSLLIKREIMLMLSLWKWKMELS